MCEGSRARDIEVQGSGTSTLASHASGSSVAQHHFSTTTSIPHKSARKSRKSHLHFCVIAININQAERQVSPRWIIRYVSPSRKSGTAANIYRIAQAPNLEAVVLHHSPRRMPTDESVSESSRSRPSTLTRTRTSSKTTSAASSAVSV